MIHEMKLDAAPFTMIESGEKTIELRLYDEKRRRVSVGDTIVFSNTDDPHDKISAKVTALHIFHDFAELYNSLPLLSCGYTSDDIDSASPDDMLEYYTREQQKQFGVVGIEIKRD